MADPRAHARPIQLPLPLSGRLALLRADRARLAAPGKPQGLRHGYSALVGRGPDGHLLSQPEAELLEPREWSWDRRDQRW